MAGNIKERIESAIKDIEKVQVMFRQKYGEECLADKEIAEALDIARAEHEELEQYRAIGTVSECREAMEKQRAKKPKFVRVADKNKNQYLCGFCGIGFYHYLDDERKWMNNRFCPKCGREIDWSDTE